MKTAEVEINKMTAGCYEDVDWNNLKPMYINIAKDVGFQKNRIGGNFVVAQAIHSQEFRNLIRSILPNCIFINLSMTQEGSKQRIQSRHGDQAGELWEFFSKEYELFEKPGEAEENTYNIDIDENMTPNDVLEKVLEVLDDKATD